MPVATKDKPCGTILADPPWPEDDSFVPHTELKGQGVSEAYPLGSSTNHYRLMTLDKIKSFQLPQIKEDCLLFLWCPFRRFHDAVEVIEAWGFRYCKTGFVWVKMTKDGENVRIGMGQRLRMCHELCLLGVRGKPVQKNKNTKSVLLEPWVAHSYKPEKMYEIIENYANGPYTEIFARRRRTGWTSYGLELEPEVAGAVG